MTEINNPSPGSKEAVEQGCLCPIKDNKYGKGAMPSRSGEMLYYFSADCPLHKDEYETTNEVEMWVEA
jgi:hypothetical protein